MKTWMKILMWFGIGAGVGFISGVRVGQRFPDRDHTEYFGWAPPEDREIYNALNNYRGGAGDISTVNGIDRVLKDTKVEEDEELEQLHPTWILPEIITDEEFNHNVDGYDQENLIFYEMDEVLFNETVQDIIPNPNDVIGIGTLDLFGGDPNNPTETIYVKNDTLGTMFRIDRLDAAYIDEFGLTPGPSEEDDDEENEP